MNNYNQANVLKNALVGIEFEFYSIYNAEKTAIELRKLLSKKIRVEDKAHSDFKVTKHEFKLEPDMSGGAKLLELVTGAMPYFEARLIIINLCKWIQINGSTDKKTSIHLNLSFDSKKINDKYRISKMNVLKFILDFKEEQVFKLFPNRRGSAYAKSIKFVLPKENTQIINSHYINDNNFIYPDSKYYGINFDKKQQNYLEFRYLGGENWEYKENNILYLLDEFLIQLWQSTASKEFNQLNIIELNKILAQQQRIVDARIDWKAIEQKWKNVQFTVDLYKEPQLINLYWAQIKNKVIKLFTHGSLVSGHINYDSDIGRVQVKDGELNYCVDLELYDFISCKLHGEFNYCDIFKSDLNGSILEGCNLYSGTQINTSKLKSCYVSHDSQLKDSYVYGNGMLKGRMQGGIFREGMYDKKIAKFDEVEIVTSQEI